MINRIIAWYVARRKKAALARVRASFAAIGHDLSGFTDEEVERGLRRVSGGFSHRGFSVAEARESVQSVAQWGKGGVAEGRDGVT